MNGFSDSQKMGRNLIPFFRLVSKGLALLADLTSTWGLRGAGAAICAGRPCEEYRQTVAYTVCL